jgi:1-deoxy-D-xylulose-5-phosphate synthase
MAPKDESELRDMLYTSVKHTSQVRLQLSLSKRKCARCTYERRILKLLKSAKVKYCQTGNDAAVIAIGSMTNYCIEAVDELDKTGLSCELINARFAKPLDYEMIDRVASKFSKIITVEENSLHGGFGSSVIGIYK